MIKILIITSNHLRHKFFVNTLAKNYEVVGVVAEEKRPLPSSEIVEEDELMKSHFAGWQQKEKQYFGEYANFVVPSEKVKFVERSQSNSPTMVEWIKSKNPDFVILFGSSIIKEPILSFFQDRVINIHLGLSPYYRGSGTNFWPLVDNKPECVGATIHLAVLDVDAGGILAQVRPQGVTPTDDSHDLGCKTIVAGAQKMVEVIEKYKQGLLKPQVQDLTKGEVYKRADFTAVDVRLVRKNLASGMISQYLQEKEARDKQYPIIEI